jgi:hypothetical protein
MTAPTSTHPAHDEVAAELRGWFTTSTPELGITVEDAWFGYVSDADGAGYPRVLLTIDDPDEVVRALESVRRIRSAEGFGIWIDDRDRASRLEDALVAAACRPVKSTTHLALVGEVRADPGPDDLEVHVVEEANLGTWASVKLRAFGDTEELPGARQLDREADVRRRELALAELWLATLGHEPVAVLAYYSGWDQLVFNLATRTPYRHRRIARSLLARWVAAGASHTRSLIINADDPGRPAELYRQLGFDDEVYWYRRYEFGAPRPS